MSHHRVRALASGQAGISIVEVMIATTILLVVSATVMRGVLGLTEISRLVTNRTDMHNGVRNATELLTQEVGQAGRIALPGRVSLAALAAAGATSLTLATSAPGDATAGMFPGEFLLVGNGPTQETVQVANAAGDTVTLIAPLENDQPPAAPVVATGGFFHGVVPPTEPNGSSGTVLKIFGDIHDDGNMVYVEYTCDLANSRLFRNSMPFDQAFKAAPTVEEILIDNIEQNPPNPDGSITPCFTYETRTVNGRTYVTNVAITLTVRTRQRDVNTGDFQRETKALLNVAPRNVFNMWQADSLNITDRIQVTPPTVLALLPGTGYVTGGDQ